MRLTAGARLGPYEIVAPLGAGAMGEVYKARDTRLGRDVAIKILSADIAASPDARQRFEREHPDGRMLVFSADRRGPPHLFRRDLTTGMDTELQPTRRFQQPLDITPDGRTLVYVERAAGGSFDLWSMPLDGGGPPVRLFETPFTETSARVSPDGRFLAFMSNESGGNETYLSPFPPAGARTRVTAGGGVHPRWSRDGRELFYLADGGRRLVSMPVDVTHAGDLGPPAPVFILRDSFVSDYDVSSDGRRFLAHVPISAGDAQPLTAVLGWPSGGSPDRRP